MPASSCRSGNLSVLSSRGASGATTLEISGRLSGEPTRVSVGTMHYDKGLEFKAVVVMGCDEDKLPLRKRVETAGDEVELEDAYETERRLFYVACIGYEIGSLSPGSRRGRNFWRTCVRDDARRRCR
jgi:superfamily I DNA/RNA helicase